MAFLRFINSPAGRWARALGGIAVVTIAVLAGGWWLLLLIPAALMLLGGVADVCPIGIFMRRPIKGSELLLSFDRADVIPRPR